MLAAIVNDTFQLHEQSISQWKKTGVIFVQTNNILKLVENNHACNFQLWQTEDKARRDDLGFEFVYRAKREIDFLNQQRNNYIEAIDEELFTILNPATPENCKVHSETPGMIIDRLSILALKIYHMNLQLERTDVNQQHLETCKQKLQILKQQQQQLKLCLKDLLLDIENKQVTFKIYKQFKMYNDPTLNPELYSTAPSSDVSH